MNGSPTVRTQCVRNRQTRICLLTSNTYFARLKPGREGNYQVKVVKFGGSSMADAGQYRKIRDILLSDPERRVVIVSAAGKRFKDDHKITDLL